MSEQPIAVVRIVDDDEELLKSMSFYLRMAGLDVLTYTSAQQFLEMDSSQRPGCIVLDQRMPGMTGLELQEGLLCRAQDLPIIFLSAHGDVPMAMQAVKRGAFDFLVKPAEPEVMLQTIRRAIDTCMQKRRQSESDTSMMALYQTLTERERQVAGLIARGLLNKQIGAELDVSLATVKMHRGNICRKLKVRSAVQIVEILRSAGALGDWRAS